MSDPDYGHRGTNHLHLLSRVRILRDRTIVQPLAEESFSASDS